MKKMKQALKALIAAALAAVMLWTALPVRAESAAADQKLDALYTLALNAINKEDYDTARKYLNISFVYCDPQTNPVMYADLLLKQACIDVIEGNDDIAVLSLDAALKIEPELADAYLVKTQIYTQQAEFEKAVENLEKYIELTEDTAMYETVAQLHEANGNAVRAQEAYDKYVAGAGADSAEAGFQAGLYRMESGELEKAIEAFEAYREDETFGAGAMYNIGICRMNLGEYAAAAEAFEACEEKGGTFEGLYYNRGISYLMTENWVNAADDFARSLETEPYKADAEYNLGICNMQSGEYEAAIAAFTILIGDGEEALTGEEQTEVENKAPVNDGAYFYRGICRGAVGQLEEAAADYTVCIEHGYELGQSYYQRAQVWAALGETDKQNSDLENSLKYAQ